MVASENRYRTVIEQCPLSIHVFAPDGASLLANASWHELWNLEEGEEGANIFEDEHVRATGLVPYIDDSLQASGPVSPPPLFYDPAKTEREGEPRWLQPFVYPVKDEGGRVHEVTLIIEDVTARKRLEGELTHQANHDPLTGLPNRALFLDRLGQALGRAGRQGEAGEGGGRVAVLFTDLDNFKYVNDSLGHRAGDELLVSVAGRLRGCLRPGDTLARLGGDEFVVVLEDVAGLADAEAAAERMARALDEAPFDLGGREVFATTSTGMALGGPGEAGGSDAEGLLRSADAAMYRAKEGGKDRHEAYEAGMRARASERLGLEGDLRRALERREFVLHYQPEVDLRSGRTVGAEALLRWQHPERGLVPPGEFVPLAEETGLIVPIGRWALGEACHRARVLNEQRAVGPPLTMSVNLSARQFRNPSLIEEVAGALEEAGLEPGVLVLEITESVVMDDATGTVGTLEGLKALGVGLAVDDFGTGYSSMAYLRRFPVDHLKVDRSFVAGLGRNPEDDVIVAGMISLAHALGLGTVAEGVETEGQLARLEGMGCDLAQGFYFSEPLTGEAVQGLLGTHTHP